MGMVNTSNILGRVQSIILQTYSSERGLEADRTNRQVFFSGSGFGGADFGGGIGRLETDDDEGRDCNGVKNQEGELNLVRYGTGAVADAAGAISREKFASRKATLALRSVGVRSFYKNFLHFYLPNAVML